jgi:hypothetical protein
MRVTAFERQESGIELLKIADGYKKYRPELNDKVAFKLAILGNPNLGEVYTGFPVRHDAVAEVKNFVFNGGSFPDVAER